MDNKKIMNQIHPTAIIGDNVEMGEGNTVGAYTVIGAIGFIRDYDDTAGTIVIGDHNRIGQFVSIMAGESGATEIGSGNMIMNYCNIGHNSTIGHHNEIGVGTIICGRVKIGNDNKIKASVSIRNRIVVGSENLIGMCSNVVKDVEDKSKIHGNPARYVSPIPSEERSDFHNGLSEKSE